MPLLVCPDAQHAFWGWGKEDNNLVRRLQLHGMWPPERPAVAARPKVLPVHPRHTVTPSFHYTDWSCGR